MGTQQSTPVQRADPSALYAAENMDLRRALDEVRREKASAINMLKQCEIWIENLTGRATTLEQLCKRTQQERDQALIDRDRLQELMYTDRRRYLDHVEELEASYKELEDEYNHLIQEIQKLERPTPATASHRPRNRSASLSFVESSLPPKDS
eukprot:TRINITY_DN20285_c0_g1_i1.p2 TRINITY_DN20285_c0_g1~~TRINITY_DN20285_c0_g1_i1.p2  ORF type:complete len:152 (+),score=38.12 TRINITY_DN20285_c0_g1_i1:58-513(+)